MKRELTLHSSGQWKKKISGKVYYFGKDYKEALTKYHRLSLEGTPLASVRRDLTVGTIADLWLLAQTEKRDSGRLQPKTWRMYSEVALAVREMLGEGTPVESLAPQHFSAMLAQVSKRWGIHRQANFVVIVRGIFKWGWESCICPSVRVGPDFKPPPKSIVRENRRQARSVIPGDDIRKMLAYQDDWMRTAILLGVNGGMGNTDVARLCWSDIKDGFIDSVRPKTKVHRAVWLWPETLESLERYRGRDTPILRTARGLPLMRDSGWDRISTRFGLMAKELGMPWSFYDLRHTFRTTADDHTDRPAVDLIMGHEPRDVGSVWYVHHRDKDRVRSVVDHVRLRLWPDGRGPLGQ